MSSTSASSPPSSPRGGPVGPAAPISLSALPLEDRESRKQESGQPEAAVSVLLVDDQLTCTLAMTAALRPLGATIHRAHTAPEALGLMLRNRYAVVILDVRMPEMSGFDLASLMQGHEETRGTPIIFLSGESTAPDDVFQGYGTGAVDYLTKPVNPAILRSKVAVFLRLAVQTQALAVMSELRRTQEKLAAATEDLSSFARAASHDLKEPARTVRILAASVERRLSGEVAKGAATELEEIRAVGARMLGIVDALASYADLAVETTWTRTDLGRVVQEIVEELRPAIDARAGEVEVEALPQLFAHPQQIRELLRNLLHNALTYCREGTPPRIRVGSRPLEVWEASRRGLNPDSAFVRVAVEDNGQGIEPEQQAQLFRAFAHLRARDEVEGAHLGLAICRRIVERHRGQIEVDSTPGVGTTIGIVLPRGEASGAARADREPSSGVPG